MTDTVVSTFAFLQAVPLKNDCIVKRFMFFFFFLCVFFCLLFTQLGFSLAIFIQRSLQHSRVSSPVNCFKVTMRIQKHHSCDQNSTIPLFPLWEHFCIPLVNNSPKKMELPASSFAALFWNLFLLLQLHFTDSCVYLSHH